MGFQSPQLSSWLTASSGGGHSFVYYSHTVIRWQAEKKKHEANRYSSKPPVPSNGFFMTQKQIHLL